jgi:multiple sugar transport system permease protein
MRPHPLARAARVTVAAAVAALFLLPLVFLVSGSLRKPGLPPPRTPELVPNPAVPGNYGDAVDLVGLGRATVNSLLVCALAVPLAVLVAALAGFALAHLPRRLARPLLALSFAATMVPLTALLVPRFALFRSLGLVDTWAPLVAPALIGMSPFYVLIYYVAFRRLPAELYEACRLEGMGPFASWRRVAMPLVRPVTAAVAVLAFVVTWSNFLDPLVYLFDRDRYTVPLALRSLAQLDPTNQPLLLAGAVLATAPVVLAFLSAQRWFLGEHRGQGWLGR